MRLRISVLVDKFEYFTFSSNIVLKNLNLLNTFIMVRHFVFNSFNFFIVVIFFLTNSLLSIATIGFTFTTSLSYSVFLTTSLSATLIILLESVGRVYNLSISNLSTSDFTLNESTAIVLLLQIFLHN